MTDIDQFRALEESLLDPDVRRSPDRLTALLSDDFIEFGASGGIFSRADVLAAADHLPEVETPLQDFRVEVATDSVALVTYRSVTRGANGQIRTALRSSVWVMRDGRWQLRFHQGTPMGLR